MRGVPKRIYLVVGFVIAASMGLLLFLMFRQPHSLRLAEDIRNSWELESYVSLTNHSAISTSIEGILSNSTNVNLLNARQISALEDQIYNCLITYSTGDFASFVKFRMPCGDSVNVEFDRDEIGGYLDGYLPTVKDMREVYFDDLSEEDKILFKDYSLKDEMDVWKYMWIVAGQEVYQGSGGKPFCNDCWKGFSPDQSWVKLSELPVITTQTVREAGHLGFKSEGSDLMLAPPSGRRDSTPKMYAEVKLHIDTDRNIGAQPFYIVFVLTTNPECWIPVSFVMSHYRGTDYIF